MGIGHLQIGRMLDIDLISEPPHAPSPQMYVSKCGNLCGQKGRKRFIASWGLRMSHICPCTPCPSPQGYRSKVESRHFAQHSRNGLTIQRNFQVFCLRQMQFAMCEQEEELTGMCEGEKQKKWRLTSKGEIIFFCCRARLVGSKLSWPCLSRGQCLH